VYPNSLPFNLARDHALFPSPEDSIWEWRGGGARWPGKETAAAARRLPRRRKETRAEGQGKGGGSGDVEVVVTVSGLGGVTRF